jgi:histidinol dehydrogenase
MNDRRSSDSTPPPTVLDPGVVEDARAICHRVRTDGDAALVVLTRQYDGEDIEGRIAVPFEEWEQAAEEVPAPVRSAIEHMAGRIRDLHGRQLPVAWEAESAGVRFGEVVNALDSVGCYVPGGRAAYPSTVLMTAIPAKVAGVERVVVCTPPGERGAIPPPVLLAATIAGVDAVYRVGGAQAVAALAYGTETIEAVSKIVGPGNMWVTAAKKEVSGLVGIDGLAGPSELVIVADHSADPAVLAVDLTAQAEHDPDARATLIALDASLVDRVRYFLDTEVRDSPREAIIRRALARASLVAVADEDEAARLVDSLAPEHLQVVTSEPDTFLQKVRFFGAAFLGPLTPVSFGDYGVGSNHVLPTMGTARFASGLRASDFVVVSSFVEARREGLAQLGREVEILAHAEGLSGHARASRVRRTKLAPGRGQPPI